MNILRHVAYRLPLGIGPFDLTRCQ